MNRPFVGGLIALALLVSACATAKPAEVVRIGAVLSLSGPASAFGMDQRDGIKLAQDEINASQMLGQTRLQVVIEDDASDADKTATAFQRLIETSDVVAIVGPTLSDGALTADPLAQQAAVPVLAISNAASGITEIGNFIFRDCLSDGQLTPPIIGALRSRAKLHTAALLYTDTDPNRSGANGFKSALENLHVRITAEQSFARDQTDFSPQLKEIAATHPDVVFVTAPSSAAAAILVQARASGLDRVPIVGSNAFNSDTILDSAGAAAEGLIVGSAWTLGNASARNQQFIQNYRARYGSDPDQLAAQAYTGVYILAAALRNTPSLGDRRALRDALEQMHGLDTPLGSFGFNAAHDPEYPATVQIVQNGEFVNF